MGEKGEENLSSIRGRGTGCISNDHIPDFGHSSFILNHHSHLDVGGTYLPSHLFEQTLLLETNIKNGTG